MAVVIETTKGDFTVDLYTTERPQTCRNFLKLCKLKYYNWNLFHTVQNNFIAQTGDPTGTGKGGESVYGIVLGEKFRYYEMEQMPKMKHNKIGLLSMVNCGNNMLGSQFFITLAPELQSLDGEHCVFGEISEGLEIILKFNETICDGDHRPYQDIRISHTVILEDPFEDPKGLIIPDRSPEPTKEALMSDRIGADEEIDDTAGMTTEEIIEMQKDKEAKARATILEIVGDIPDADMAPPENVLFVCKLNPVTNEDDLEIIFSRFGKIVGCEVIKDRQTGDSLQYAFIEFADRKSCEEAYFKMDNVLIDDRRIHVDFSQSVAKMRWRGKGKGIKYFDDDKNRKNDSGENNIESEEKHLAGSRKKKRSNEDWIREEIRNGEEKKQKWEGKYQNMSLGDNKHEKRRENRHDKEYARNGEKYSSDKNKREGKLWVADTYEGRRDREDRKRYDERSRDRRGRSKERNRDKSDRVDKTESHKGRKHREKQHESHRQKDNYDPGGEQDDYRKHHKQYPSRKKDCHRDQSRERYKGRSEDSKHKKKRK